MISKPKTVKIIDNNNKLTLKVLTAIFFRFLCVNIRAVNSVTNAERLF